MQYLLRGVVALFVLFALSLLLDPVMRLTGVSVVGDAMQILRILAVLIAVVYVWGGPPLRRPPA